jgi:hypothetical protein
VSTAGVRRVPARWFPFACRVHQPIMSSAYKQFVTVAFDKGNTSRIWSTVSST